MAAKEEASMELLTGPTANGDAAYNSIQFPELAQLQPPSSDAAPQPPADFNVEKVLSRVRSESMYELRKLKLQHRPVSEFCNKQQLEQFFSQRCSRQLPLVSQPQPTANAVAGTCTATPIGVSNEEHTQSQGNVAERTRQFDSQAQAVPVPPQRLRPEAVQVEVQAVFERQMVSEVLQGPLQQEMERVLQEGLERRRSRQQRRPRHRSRAHDHSEHGGRSPAVICSGGRRPSSRRVQAQAGGARVRSRIRFVPPENGQYPVPRRDQSRIVERVRQSPALNSLGPETRDMIVAEIGHLVQQQMVTSALSGEFRGVMELHIQERADRINQGQDSESFVRSLGRRSAHRSSRVAQEHGSYDSDEPGPSQSSFVELRQEVVEMKAQLQELKQMMRVSFDLQLDIQRAIRQEVAAALTAFCNPPGASAQATVAGVGPALVPPCVMQAGNPPQPGYSSADSNAQVVDSGSCVICSEASIDSVVYRCGHMCVCMACGLELKAQGLKCPICRAPITDVIRAYASML